jgi:hypothetical protein
MRKVLTYFGGFIVRPLRTADEIARDPAGLRAGVLVSLLFLGAYSLTVLIFFLLGHAPVNRGWLTIPPERWYLVQTFTTIPVGFAGFLSYAGICHLLSRAVGGRGTFETTFASQMFALIIPCVVFMLLLELLVAPVMIALGAKGVPWPEWVEIMRVFVLPFAWIFFLATAALSRIQKIHWLPSLGFVLVALVPTAVIMSVFIR